MKFRASFLGLLAALALFTIPAQAQPPLPQPKLLAVYFYADWCPNCKLLSPELETARDTFDLDPMPILFVKLDLTNKDSIHQSVLLASALGIGAFVKAQGSATGYVAVLDAHSKKELARFDKMDSSDKIGARLKALAAS